ncbi:hypothetical protein EK599_22730 [Vibrio sp. T187]|uniref:hypothetical protein n=1 Tax=Vibrio TaxID=662 RepID=UPI0010C9CB58|nr:MULTISPECIES: hypothetical protein [Vibrio]MBW3698497.1 hypothetical protein [Vibrio sp. T187]
MTSLQACFNNAGVENISIINNTYNDEYQSLLNANDAFFTRACANKPEHSERQILLGLLTKLHIEATSSYQSGIKASEGMQQVFESSVGKEHASKFKHTQVSSLVCITHLWLYLQGRLGMDFSLANDHAQATSELIIKSIVDTSDEQRTAFLESYYLGFEVFQQEAKPNSLLDRIKRLFNFF